MSKASRPHPAINRKDWMEAHLIGRREREDATRAAWKSTAKYFKTWDVTSKKYAELTSPESYQASMNAYVERKRLTDQEEALNVRRNKLATLLRKEDEQYRTEIRALADRRYYPRPGTATPAPSEPHPMATPTPRTIGDARERAETSRDEPENIRNQKIEFLEERETDSPGNPELKYAEIRERVATPRAPRRSPEELLSDVRLTEREASALQREHAALEHALNRLREKAELRSRLDQRQLQEPAFWSKAKLKQPYKIQIQAQSHVVLRLMEFDLDLIETMMNILRLADEKDSSLFNDLGQIHLKMLQNIRSEQFELLQSECLFHEEAERVWNRKTLEWEDDRVARESLIKKTLRLIETKVQERIAANLERRRNNISRRENVLRDLDKCCSTSQEVLPTSRPRFSRDIPSAPCPAIERLKL